MPTLAPSTIGTSAAWFRRVMWLGIGANLALAVPTVIAPAGMLASVGLPVPPDIMWPRFAALLLIILSLFYMPAAIDPTHYRAIARLAIGSRLAGVAFFFLLHTTYWFFGALDLAFLVPLAALLPRVPRTSH